MTVSPTLLTPNRMAPIEYRGVGHEANDHQPHVPHLLRFPEMVPIHIINDVGQSRRDAN